MIFLHLGFVTPPKPPVLWCNDFDMVVRHQRIFVTHKKNGRAKIPLFRSLSEVDASGFCGDSCSLESWSECLKIY